jgi:hypothetical protein
MATRKRRQFQDMFTEVFTGSVVASVTIVGAAGRNTQAVTVPGVLLNDICFPVYTSADVGSLIMYAKVTAADTVTIVFENNTAGGITPPASTTYGVIVARVNPEILA